MTADPEHFALCSRYWTISFVRHHLSVIDRFKTVNLALFEAFLGTFT